MCFAIETNELSKSFGEIYAGNKLNLRLKYGVFLGLNGAGKTTTIHALPGRDLSEFRDGQGVGESVGVNPAFGSVSSLGLRVSGAATCLRLAGTSGSHGRRQVCCTSLAEAPANL